MTNASCPTTALRPTAPAVSLKGHMHAALMWMKQVLRVARQRHQLKHLDARLLKDIGLTREQAQAEARRPFWDLP